MNCLRTIPACVAKNAETACVAKNADTACVAGEHD
jgi:hypothetical protein